ncbi:MAG: hypothetical protein U5R49_22425 [Deltaproteobacteria bacterium]|nr:hypothetical protein [Deltaproteobacteria bacterium]
MLESRRKKSAFRRPAFWVTTLLMAGAMAFAWWLWQYHYAPSHQLNYMLLNISDEPRKVLSGETFRLHPNDRVQIQEISTSIPLNIGIRLVATDFDVNALRYEALPLRSLLPKKTLSIDMYSRFRSNTTTR